MTLPDQDVARLDGRADADDPRFVEIAQGVLRHVRDVARDLLGPELGVAGLDVELLDVDRREEVVLDQALGDQDRVLVVVAAPGHERHQHVAAEGELTLRRAGPVREDLPPLDAGSLVDDRLLVDAGVLVGPAELGQRIDVGAELLGAVSALPRPALDAHDDALRVDLVDDAAALGQHDRARVPRDRGLEARAHEGGLDLEEGHGLPLHVGAHERPVGVVVLQERDQGRGHRHELLGRDVLVVDLVALGRDELAVEARDDPILADAAGGVGLGVGLGDDEVLLLPGGQVEGEGVGLRGLLVVAADALVLLLQVLLLDDLAEREGRVPDLGDLEVVDDPALLDPLVRGLDEAEVVDPRVAGQRRDQADVRALRGLDRADAAVVRRVHVADLEPGALAGETARPEGREAPLVRDLRERVRLVHELRELRGAEELLDRGDDRLGVDEVVRHRRVDVLVDGHLLLDGALHPHEADPELVLEQLADRPDAAVSEVVDVVGAPHVPLQPEEVPDHAEDVRGGQGPRVLGGIRLELDVELETADAREVVLLRVEEHALEEVLGRLVGRRVPRAQAAVDLEDRLVLGLVGVLADRVHQDVAREVPVGEEDLDLLDAPLLQRLDRSRSELLPGLEEHLAGGEVHDVGQEAGLLDGRLVHGALDRALLRDLLLVVARQLDAGEHELRLPLGPGVTVAELLLLQDVLADRQVGAAALEAGRDPHVELAEDGLVRLEAERPQEDRGRELALAVDAHEEHGLLVVLELHPRAAIGDDLRQVAVRGLLREEDSRRAVELGDDHALGAVDHERPVLRHERDVAEEDFLFLGVPHRLDPRVGVLVVDEQAEGDLERDRIGHAPFLALGHGVLHLEVDGVAADVAERDAVRVLGAALVAGNDLLVRVRRHDPRSARPAVHPQVLQPLEPSALALPVSDRVLDELELARAPEVGEREYAREHRLEPGLLPLLGEQVHLEETLVGPALDVDQIRKIHEGPDLRVIPSLGRHCHLSHLETPYNARDAARPRN